MNDFLITSLEDNRPYFLSEFNTLGSAEECNIAISSNDIEKRHARIEIKNDDVILLKDLRTSLGTFINDLRVQEAYLKDGDIIRLGKKEFFFSKPKAQNIQLPTSKNKLWNEELNKLNEVSKNTFSILLLGPSGTGKDVLASTIHQLSDRSKNEFVSVNCSALTETLIESELFGHIKGSFTGAVSDRKGAFEAARGGTLFLDEIGDLPLPMQAKLLRALENNEIRPVGSDKTLKTNVRIIAATHQDLTKKIQAGQFRQDLYFRLNVISIKTPSLIQRLEDFEDLTYLFAKQLRVRFSFGAIEKMKEYSWPGNIRELKNFVTRISVMYPKILITEEHIIKNLDFECFSQPSNEPQQTTPQIRLPLIKEVERELILKRLEVNLGNQKRTAKELGLPKSTLHDKLKYYGIDPKMFKNF